jgi:hypothetical protein
VLILGGEGGTGFFGVNPVAFHVRTVLIGRDAPLIGATARPTGRRLLSISMAQAVSLAAAQAYAGDAVLMSPACASLTCLTPPASTGFFARQFRNSSNRSCAATAKLRRTGWFSGAGKAVSDALPVRLAAAVFGKLTGRLVT